MIMVFCVCSHLVEIYQLPNTELPNYPSTPQKIFKTQRKIVNRWCYLLLVMHLSLSHFDLKILHFAPMEIIEQVYLSFGSLRFASLHFTSLHFTSLHFTSLHFTSLHFTSLHFTSFFLSLSLLYLNRKPPPKVHNLPFN